MAKHLVKFSIRDSDFGEQKYLLLKIERQIFTSG